MKKLIKHIRSQPKSKIDSYAFMVAGTFTGIVALVWAFSLPQKMERVNGSEESNSQAPFSNLLKETGEQLAAVKNGLKSKESEGEAEATTSEEIILSEEEITKAKEAIAANASLNTEATTTIEAVPVLIATTSATTTYSASSTP
jgi:hypothetical protein